MQTNIWNKIARMPVVCFTKSCHPRLQNQKICQLCSFCRSLWRDPTQVINPKHFLLNYPCCEKSRKQVLKIYIKPVNKLVILTLFRIVPTSKRLPGSIIDLISHFEMNYQHLIKVSYKSYTKSDPITNAF